VTDFFDIPAKIGDKILFVNQDEFCTGAILEKILHFDNIKVLVNIDNEKKSVLVHNKNFIIINDIIKNHPQYFM